MIQLLLVSKLIVARQFCTNDFKIMPKHSWEKQENPISFDTLPVNWLAIGLSELRARAISKLLELTKVVGGACNDNNATDSSVLMF